jgi:hypothetical protein
LCRLSINTGFFQMSEAPYNPAFERTAQAHSLDRSGDGVFRHSATIQFPNTRPESH